jgi:glycerol-3-phosphate acyltransferase PlsY
MDTIIYYIISALTGYLLGSVPFALVIGKVFYKTDIRQHGSGNLGGSNAGRVLGKKAGIAVMILDILKVTLAMLLVSLFTEGEICLIIAGLFSAVGHCFPVFARFHGGKAVATMYGFLFGMIVVAGRSILLFFIPLATFLLVIFVTRIVSVSSIASSLAAVAYTALFEHSLALTLSLVFFAVLLTVRHIPNIKNFFEAKKIRSSG